MQVSMTLTVRRRPTRPGIALLLVLVAVAMATILSLSFLTGQSVSVAIAENVDDHAPARAIAESGLMMALSEVQQNVDWRTDFSDGTWVASQSYQGGSFTIVGEDGVDTDADNVISFPSEGDGDLADDTNDLLTLTVTGTYDGVSHIVRAVVTPGSGGPPGSTGDIPLNGNDHSDAEEDPGGDVKLENDKLELGQMPWVAYHFTNVTVPQGATITSAYVEMCAADSSSEDTDLTIFGHDADNAAIFSSSTDDISDRTTTSASITWANVPNWSMNNWYQTPDFASVVEEIVGRGGWSSGNAMVIMFRSDDTDGKRLVIAYDDDPSKTAKLNISYTGGGGGGGGGSSTVRWIEKP